MPECITVVLSLVCLMIANIIMGKKIADFKQEYNKEKSYASAEINARKRKLGLWQDRNPIKPQDFRKMKRK